MSERIDALHRGAPLAEVGEEIRRMFLDARIPPDLALFDEQDPAVTSSIRSLIDAAHLRDRKVGLCGRRPSDDPGFARLLVDPGIDSVSVTPDNFLLVKDNVAAAEHARRPAKPPRQALRRADPQGPNVTDRQSGRLPRHPGSCVD